MAEQVAVWHAVQVEFLAIAVCGVFLLYLVLEVVRQPRLFQRFDDPYLGRRRVNRPAPRDVLDLREQAVDAFFSPANRRSQPDRSAQSDHSAQPQNQR